MYVGCPAILTAVSVGHQCRSSMLAGACVAAFSRIQSVTFALKMLFLVVNSRCHHPL